MTAPVMALALLLTPSLARPQEAPQRSRPQEVVKLVADSYWLPPELAADSLLLLVESGRINENEWKRELLEAAFQFAGQAQHPVPLRSISPLTDERSQLTARAIQAKVDALSLRLRAVTAMLRIDQKAARDLFQSIGTPALGQPTCSQALVPSTGDFYQVLGAVAASFTPAEIRERRHIRFLESYLFRLTTPAEVTAAARLITTVNPSTPDLQSLVLAFTDSLSRVRPNDRYFGLNGRSDIPPALQSLLELCVKQQIDTQALVSAYRSFLVRHLTAIRCENNVSQQLSDFEKRMTLDHFNDRIRRIAGNTDRIAAIAGEELRPEKVEASAKLNEYWQSAETKELLRMSRRIRFGGTHEPLTDAQKDTAEWRWDLQQLLNKLSDWKAAEETEADAFHQKCLTYRALLREAPNSKARANVWHEYVFFVAGSSMLRSNPAEWALQARELIASARRNSEDEKLLLAELQQSQQTALTHYAALEATLPRRPAPKGR